VQWEFFKLLSCYKLTA